ncbi:metal-dependent hydrolase [Haladaptatus caseinilyticus]|uniref:metal-dependent hydrolase n=1 Tax=Haladaptatus caseinilyticus TaxID=2993314 RepID=UPI00224AB3E1|nr:metal-dependent hydrolase [Haladaptatus caseinilyticus]
MWPWGHLATGYLLYSGYCAARSRNPPTDITVLALALGTQFPDLIDKPLAWNVGILPTGRSLTHSLLSASVILGCLYYFSYRGTRRDIWVAFAIGYLSHLIADIALPLLQGDTAYANFLLWPFLSTPPYKTAPSFTAHFTNMEFTWFFVFQLFLVVLAIYYWFRDGFPGLRNGRDILPNKQSK